MGTQLQQILRNLCFNSEWKYAVFWKLKHRARMVLTWEDAYYENHAQHNPLENKCFGERLNNFSGGNYSHNALGLAVAKMSCQVYSLGEGIVGQVAATGKHRWIFANKCMTNSYSSFEYGNGWQAQFSAGIRTIVVVAVVPHGVVQLGSLNEVFEDLKLVNHIRDVFFALQDSSLCHIYSQMQSSIDSSPHLPHISTRSSGSQGFTDCTHSLEQNVNKERPNILPPMFSSLHKYNNDSSYIVPLPANCQRKAVELVNNNGRLESSMPVGDEIAKLLPPKYGNFNLEHQRQVQLKLPDDKEWVGETNGWRDAAVGSKHNVIPYLQNVHVENNSVYNSACSADNNHVAFSCFPSDLFDSATCDTVKFDSVDYSQDGRLHMQNPSDMLLPKEPEKKLDVLTESSHTDTSNAFSKFSVGSELLEALGPSFFKQSDWEVEKAEAGTLFELPEGISSSHLTSDSGSEHLLEAVVAKICNSNDAKSGKSFHNSVQSLSTTKNIPEPSSLSKHTIVSAGFSIDQSSLGEEEPQYCLSSSGVCVERSSRGFSSTYPSTCSEQVERYSEPAKTNKKRARAGENCRPRPRDRQLIQDRIKELRELVPNGSKCSIDSLLERSIKHMLFLQGITKHADKLKKCAESKLCNKETGIQGSINYDRGSSWAVEVGSHLKVCTIIVENLNMNGQMLVEMLCEECSHFLEIAEAIRSLGLTILKGVTEAHGEKTWICFVVEGQDNRSMHRMDILWSLVQILQPKTVA